MVSRLNQEQLSQLRSLGFEGDGELAEIIDWLGHEGFCWLHARANGKTGYSAQAWIGEGDEAPAGNGKTPLEAMYALACALKGGE